MQSIEIKNQELRNILDEFLSVLLSVDRSKYPYGPTGQGEPGKELTSEYACSEEYLLYMKDRIAKKQTVGFPDITHGVDLGQWKPPQQELKDAIKKFDVDFMTWSASRNSAVKMVYPVGGFMGWHTNENASGLNILFSWSKEGKGHFKYQDPITKEFVVMQDTPGWTCKVGYFGNTKEPDKVVWHCASAKTEERVTLAFIIPHQGLWENMCEDIQMA